MIVVNKECKCRKCKAVLKVGEKAFMHKKVIGHASVVRGSTFVRWEMECADGKCGERLLAQQNAKRASEAQKQAQDMVDEMRKGVSGIFGMEYPQDIIARIVAKYVAEGIIVQ